MFPAAELRSRTRHGGCHSGLAAVEDAASATRGSQPQGEVRPRRGAPPLAGNRADERGPRGGGARSFLRPVQPRRDGWRTCCSGTVVDHVSKKNMDTNLCYSG